MPSREVVLSHPVRTAIGIFNGSYEEENITSPSRSIVVKQRG